MDDVVASYPRYGVSTVVRLELRTGLKEGFPQRVDVFANGQHVGCLAKADVTPQILKVCPANVAVSITPLFRSLQDIVESYENFRIN